MGIRFSRFENYDIALRKRLIHKYFDLFYTFKQYTMNILGAGTCTKKYGKQKVERNYLTVCHPHKDNAISLLYNLYTNTMCWRTDISSYEKFKNTIMFIHIVIMHYNVRP